MTPAEDFTLPKRPPDFSVMSRDALELYAANADFVLRSQQEVIRSRVWDIMRLKEVLGRAYPQLDINFGSTPAKIIPRLCEGDASKFELLSAIYWERFEQPEVKIIDVFICKIRPFMRAVGYPIETLWGRGYRLSDRDGFCKMLREFSQNGTLPDVDLSAPKETLQRLSEARVKALREDIVAGRDTLKSISVRHGVSQGCAQYHKKLLIEADEFDPKENRLSPRSASRQTLPGHGDRS